MKFVIFKDKKKEWRWKLLAKNGKSIAVSGEGYKRRASAYVAIHKVFAASTSPILLEKGSRYKKG